MPAAPLDVNWEAVKAHALTHGVRETARAYGIAPGTLFARSSREGWLEHVHTPTQAQVPKSMQAKASNACDPAQAARNTQASLGEKTRSRFARGIARAALNVAHMRPAKVLANAQPISQLVSAGAKLHGWDKAEPSQALVQIAIQGPLPVVEQPGTGPAMDVEH